MVLVDTNVLLDIATSDENWFEWLRSDIASISQHRFVHTCLQPRSA